MPFPSRSSRISRAAALLLAVLPLGCGDAAGPEAREGVEFLVGTWEAAVLQATSVADPGRNEDLIAAGATFIINVQPSGQYTATLTVFGFPVTEIGTLQVQGSALTLYREFPTPDTATATLTQLSQDRIRLLGETTFAFDPATGAEDATLLTELVRQTS